jgi:hypothetical protein
MIECVGIDPSLASRAAPDVSTFIVVSVKRRIALKNEICQTDNVTFKIGRHQPSAMHRFVVDGIVNW